ncbi:MAG TPA: hypothetical protein VFA04_07375 [Bryobacteraceae bacterium]|nr:hypothetical protein [Bryobacteraceae bacterium]
MRETRQISLHRLIQGPGLDRVKFGEIAIEHHPVASEEEYPAPDRFGRHEQFLCLFHH